MYSIVGVSDMKVSNDTDTILVTYSLGACVGLSIYDPSVHVGGLLHFMLPESTLDPAKAEENPFMFADTGIPALLESAFTLGAKPLHMRVLVAGGSQALDQGSFLNIGKRNAIAVKEICLKLGLTIEREDLGGTINRSLKIDLRDGRVWLKSSGRPFCEL